MARRLESDEDRSFLVIRLPVHERAESEIPHVTDHVTHQVTPQVQRLLAVMDGELYRDELQARVGITNRKYFRIDFLTPAMESGLIEMTIPDKPNSSKQRYRLTASGSKLQDELTVHDRTTPKRTLNE